MTKPEKKRLIEMTEKLRVECHHTIQNPDSAMEVDEAIDGVLEAIEQAD